MVLHDPYAFFREHRRCGELDGSVWGAYATDGIARNLKVSAFHLLLKDRKSGTEEPYDREVDFADNVSDGFIHIK